MGMLQTIRSVVQFRKFERDAVTRRLNKAANIDDLRKIAKRRLPGGVFDYIDGGAEDESALYRNSASFGRYEFRPRILRDMSSIDTSTTLLGKTIPMPLVLAPTGFSRIADPQGELAVARAAARAGIPYSLSTMSTRSIEEVAAVSDGPKYFQVYTWKDRGLVKDLIQRSAAAGYEAIILTVDTAVLGRRERDVRRGFTLPPKIGVDTIIDGIVHPKWTWDFVRAEPIVFSNIVGQNEEDGSETAVSLAEHVHRQFDPKLSWLDIDWLRDVWDGPIMLKGIQTIEDAKKAVEVGVEAIALSNHGGRQLDSAPAIVDLVAPVREAVGDSIEIICDGGVRRGSDIVKAVALGANAVMVGRPYLYGLGAGGERGVDFVLDFFEAGLRQTMSLIGTTGIQEITGDYICRSRR